MVATWIYLCPPGHQTSCCLCFSLIQSCGLPHACCVIPRVHKCACGSGRSLDPTRDCTGVAPVGQRSWLRTDANSQICIDSPVPSHLPACWASLSHVCADCCFSSGAFLSVVILLRRCRPGLGTQPGSVSPGKDIFVRALFCC